MQSKISIRQTNQSYQRDNGTAIYSAVTHSKAASNALKRDTQNPHRSNYFLGRATSYVTVQAQLAEESLLPKLPTLCGRRWVDLVRHMNASQSFTNLEFGPPDTKR